MLLPGIPKANLSSAKSFSHEPSTIRPTRLHRSLTQEKSEAGLQLRQHRLGAADADIATRLLLGVYDLAIVDDQGCASNAVARDPVKLLGEFEAGIGEEELAGSKVS